MQVTLTIPDDLAAAVLESADRDPARAALEAIGLEAFRERKITAYQLRTLLGIPSRYEFDGFLKEHQVETYASEGFEHNLADL
jgi:hypothetical protein